MRKSVLYILLLSVFLVSCSKPTEFTEEAKKEKVVDYEENEVAFEKILEKHQGKKMLINVWASWCKDCVVALPKVKQFQKENPEIDYVFLSLDKSIGSWKKGVSRFQTQGDHYFLKEGKKGNLGKFLKISWIPRYIVVDETGNITLFKAIEITNKNIKEALKGEASY